MIPLKKWLYYLLDENGHCLTVQNGNVQPVAGARPLPHSPDNWTDIQLGWEREFISSMGGVAHSFSFPFGFVKEATTILADRVYKYNFEKPTYLLIQQRALEITNTSFRFIYKYWYKNRLDLTSFKQEENQIEVKADEGGVAKAFKERKDTTYELSMDQNYVLIHHDGMNLNSQAKFTFPTELEIDLGLTGVGWQTAPVTSVGAEGDAFGAAFWDQRIEYMGDSRDYGVYVLNNKTNMFTEVDISSQPITFRFEGVLAFRLTELPEESRIRFHLYASTPEADPVNVSPEWSSPWADQATEYSFPLQTEIVVPPGQRLFMAIEVEGVRIILGAKALLEFLPSAVFSISFANRKAGSLIRAKRSKVVFEELVEKITGSKENCDSSFLDDDNILITCGDAIRGLEGARMKTSLKDFLEHCRCVHAAGHGVENGKIIVKHFTYFIKPQNPTKLGRARKFKTLVAKELLASELEVGYKEKEIEGVNGKFEFNNTYRYTLPSSSAKKTYSLVNPYCAQPFYIEIVRINTAGKDTTDNQADNEIFILSCENSTGIPLPLNVMAMRLFGIDWFEFPRDTFLRNLRRGDTFTIQGANINNGTFTLARDPEMGFLRLHIFVVETLQRGPVTGGQIAADYFPLKRRAYKEIEGIPNPDTIYNIEDLTPSRIIKKHQRWLDSMLWHHKGEKMEFQTTEKNPQLRTVNLLDETFDEDSHKEIGDDYIFAPFWHEYEIEVPNKAARNLPQLLAEDLHRSFSCEWEEGEFAGVYHKIGIAPDTNKEQVFRVLSSPFNDLTKLIP